MLVGAIAVVVIVMLVCATVLFHKKMQMDWSRHNWEERNADRLNGFETRLGVVEGNGKAHLESLTRLGLSIEALKNRFEQLDSELSQVQSAVSFDSVRKVMGG